MPDHTGAVFAVADSCLALNFRIIYVKGNKHGPVGALFITFHQEDDTVLDFAAHGSKGKIAEAVSNQTTVNNLQRLQNMGMVADDDVGTGGNTFFSEDPLIVLWYFQQLRAPMEGHDDNVGLFPHGTNILQDHRQIAIGSPRPVGPGVKLKGNVLL